jgi:hypothetical protein
MTAATEKTPNVLWAQRPTCVYVTIDVQDVKGAFDRDPERLVLVWLMGWFFLEGCVDVSIFCDLGAGGGWGLVIDSSPAKLVLRIVMNVMRLLALVMRVAVERTLCCGCRCTRCCCACCCCVQEEAHCNPPRSPHDRGQSTLTSQNNNSHKTDAKLDVANDDEKKHATLTFAGASGGDAYALSLPLYAAVDKDKSKFNVLPRHVFLVLEKAEAGSWPRLTKESTKGDKHIKVDWDKWVDSDEEAGPDDFDMGGMGGFGGGMGGGMPGMMGGMGGMMGGMGGGMGGMDISQLMAQMGGGGMGGDMMGGGDSDDDEEGLPSLEAADGGDAAAADAAAEDANGSGGDKA